MYHSVTIRNAETVYLVMLLLWFTIGAGLWYFQGWITGIAWFLGGCFLPHLEKKSLIIEAQE
jgi:hypothetical protein